MRRAAGVLLLSVASGGCSARPEAAPPPDLLEAIRLDSLPLVLALLDAGTSPAAPDSTGALPLHLAITLQRDTIVSELLAEGADPLQRGVEGTTAWDVAMLHGNAGIVERLLRRAAQDAGAGTAVQQWLAGVRGDDPAPPRWSDVLSGELLSIGLMYAAHHDRADLITSLRRGREIPNRTGYHALAVAARWGHARAVRALLDIDVHPDLESGGGLRATPLYWAATAGDPEVARLLLAAGAEADRAIQGGRRPIDAARARGDTVMVELLDPR